MGLVRLTKFEVAEKQLAKAIELFCAQEPLPAITLAGAAEEILGKLVKDGGGVSALEEEVKDRCDLYQTVFGHYGDPKVFADLMTILETNLSTVCLATLWSSIWKKKPLT